jgi:hypothetical protein
MLRWLAGERAEIAQVDDPLLSSKSRGGECDQQQRQQRCAGQIDRIVREALLDAPKR